MKLKLPFKLNKNSLMVRALALLLILILPFNIMGIAMSVISYYNSIKSAERVISYTLDSHAALLDTQIYNTYSQLYELLTNNAFLTDMRSTDKDYQYRILRYQLVRTLNQEIQTSNMAETFFIYLVSHDDYIQIPNFNASNAGTRPHYEYIENFDSYPSGWFLNEGHSQMILVLYSSAQNTYYGAAINLDDFLAQFESITSYDSLAYSFEETSRESTNRTRYFNHQIADGIYLTASVSSMDLNSSLGILPFMLILFFIIYLALIPCLYLMMKRYVDTPLGRLNLAHLQLRQGNDNYRITDPANSIEFKDAYESFNQMAYSLHRLQKEVIEKEISNKQLQIDFLQLQIRPHFLLNSFNVLYTLIQNSRRESAQEMVLFLSDYFRYLFRSVGQLQLFSKERKLIEDYMHVVKIYYPDAFEVSYQLEPILDTMRVPPLLLHSFMENIIAHALLPDRTIHIVFSGEYEDGLVTFYISDDGKGMDENAVRSINNMGTLKRYSIEDGKNVGIKNSIWRLKYFFGDQAEVVCDSEVNVGTTFTITIPYDLEEYE